MPTHLDGCVDFLQAREGGTVGVIKALGRHLSKPKGAPPGMVQVSKEQLVKVSPRNVLEAAGQGNS